MSPSSTHIRTLLTAYLDRHPGERDALVGLRATLDAAGDPTGRTTLPGHITCSVAVIDRDARVLHVLHRGLGLLLAPGGHVEADDETLLAAALREVGRRPGSRPPPSSSHRSSRSCPIDIDVHDIDVHDIDARPDKGEAAHRHYDFRFVFHLADDAPDLRLQAEEVDGAAWLPFDEVTSPTLRAKLVASGLDGAIRPANAPAGTVPNVARSSTCTWSARATSCWASVIPTGVRGRICRPWPGTSGRTATGRDGPGSARGGRAGDRPGRPRNSSTPCMSSTGPGADLVSVSSEPATGGHAGGTGAGQVRRLAVVERQGPARADRPVHARRGRRHPGRPPLHGDGLVALTDFATVGAAYATHSRTGRGRLRHDLVARRVLAELPAWPVRVLDVGCGDGEMTLRIAAAGHRVTATDPSALMLGAAARRLAARPELAPRVRLLEAGVEDLFFDGDQFDAVCCHGVLIYLDDTPGSVTLLAGLVAPAGC
ncbi:tRNA 5-carboxymethoxyuridine methyltransferase [Streptomyces narbonensis]